MSISDINMDSNFIVLIYQFSKILLSHSLFRILLIIYCMGNTSILTLGSMINIISENFGFSSSVGSITAFGVIFTGLVSSMIYSVYFIKRKRQTIILACYCFFSIIFLFFSALSGLYRYRI